MKSIMQIMNQQVRKMREESEKSKRKVRNFYFTKQSEFSE